MWVSRCGKEAKKVEDLQKPVTTLGPLRRPYARGTQVPTQLLRRSRGTQGRAIKLPELHAALYEYFLMIRSAVATRISTKLMLIAARTIAQDLTVEMKRLGVFAEIPQIDYKWLRRWRLRYNVVLRRPNRRFKVARSVLSSRLRTMWQNNVRLRALHMAIFKHDMVICGADQKGIHRNEGGSRDRRTLQLQGAPEVPLKENHAATRERISIMTWATSSQEEADRPDMIPLEIMFKGTTEQTLRGLSLPPGMRAKLVYSEKASYRVQHVLDFLVSHLEEWKDGRDWRILYLDAFRAHLDQRVFDTVWDRGYVVLYHGGGTTGVCQVNDTDLHHQFERIYLECEEQ